MAKVLTAAKKNNVAMEINSGTSRLDLKDTHVKEAIEKGVKLVINSDAHSEKGLKNVEFGIAQARRGWADAKDVINTLPWKRFEKYLSK